MPPDSGGICMGVDQRNRQFASGLPPGRQIWRSLVIAGTGRAGIDEILPSFFLFPPSSLKGHWWGCCQQCDSCRLLCDPSEVRRPRRAGGQASSYLTERVYQVVLQQSVPAQIRQLVLYISNAQGQVDEFVRELTLANRLYKYFL